MDILFYGKFQNNSWPNFQGKSKINSSFLEQLVLILVDLKVILPCPVYSEQSPY